ncbi:hypothetical protein GQ43DRAFT_191422 [Delitschia confertaspora ATCC 74209]|uniref:Uncharacterized protein n=1 Tax=Delitschia confertaspora ATCC 74209 TaxID=1513339 RepID=A0A9P4JE30_9PLEO|nr:hypothetical protein GQ43DRAFT_191422 [Delitschia confertaspora ATCC 74209]
MKSLLFLLPLLGLGWAAEQCSCPKVKCPAKNKNWIWNCQCVNSNEQDCMKRCPGYQPQYIRCVMWPPGWLAFEPTPVPEAIPKIEPTVITGSPVVLEPTPKSKPIPQPKPTPTCTCDQMMCPMMWPQSCACQNAAKKKCFQECGGTEPAYQACEEPIGEPTPTPVHKICGGGRGNQELVCDQDEVCIAAPGTCGPACDAMGVCVKDRMCGGLAGIGCPDGLQCINDPRDDCDPERGGADCAGLCY